MNHDGWGSGLIVVCFLSGTADTIFGASFIGATCVGWRLSCRELMMAGGLWRALRSTNQEKDNTINNDNTFGY